MYYDQRTIGLPFKGFRQRFLVTREKKDAHGMTLTRQVGSLALCESFCARVVSLYSSHFPEQIGLKLKFDSTRSKFRKSREKAPFPLVHFVRGKVPNWDQMRNEDFLRSPHSKSPPTSGLAFTFNSEDLSAMTRKIGGG